LSVSGQIEETAMDLPKIRRILFNEDMIRERIKVIGNQISRDYADKELILVGVLKGSLYFLADLSRTVDIPVKLDMISIGVYSNTTDQTGIVRINKDLDLDIKGRHVLVIEDAVRTGLTLGYLVQNLTMRMPESVKICSLLVNPAQQLIELPIAYAGFEVSAEYIVGYGSDINGKWRNLPFIAEMDKYDFYNPK
jgi:hypoxanthine phosphoribosyltransferase